MNRRVWASDRIKNAPKWVWSYLRGVDDSARYALYSTTQFGQALLVWVLTGPDGKQFGPGNDEWLKESHEYKSALTGKHVWRDKWAIGEYKVW